MKTNHGLRRQSIIEALLNDVIQGSFHPGQHLVTQSLAKRFGVSHTPIREALIALAGIGIIDLLPNRGAVVRQVTPVEVREVCQVRRALECEAVRLAIGRIDPDALRALDADLRELIAVRSPDRHRFVQHARAVDSRLHDLIAGSCGNAFLAHELSRFTILFRAFRDASWQHDEARNDYRRLVLEAHEHLAIVNALIAGDRPNAVRAMARHIRSGLKYWSRALPETTRTSPTPNHTIASPQQGENDESRLFESSESGNDPGRFARSNGHPDGRPAGDVDGRRGPSRCR